MKKIKIEKINKTNGRRDIYVIPVIPYENPEKYLSKEGFKKIQGPHWTQYEKENEFYREVAIIKEEE